MRAAIYACVSTADQTCENQLRELRTDCEARGLSPTEYVDAGVSGAKESGPALDALLKDARRRKFTLLIVWKLDRLGRSPSQRLRWFQLAKVGVTKPPEISDVSSRTARAKRVLTHTKEATKSSMAVWPMCRPAASTAHTF